MTWKHSMNYTHITQNVQIFLFRLFCQLWLFKYKETLEPSTEVWSPHKLDICDHFEVCRGQMFIMVSFSMSASAPRQTTKHMFFPCVPNDWVWPLKRLDKQIGWAVAELQSLYWFALVKKELSFRTKLSLSVDLYVPIVRYQCKLRLATERISTGGGKLGSSAGCAWPIFSVIVWWARNLVTPQCPQDRPVTCWRGVSNG